MINNLKAEIETIKNESEKKLEKLESEKTEKENILKEKKIIYEKNIKEINSYQNLISKLKKENASLNNIIIDLNTKIENQDNKKKNNNKIIKNLEDKIHAKEFIANDYKIKYEQIMKENLMNKNAIKTLEENNKTLLNNFDIIKAELNKYETDAMNKEEKKEEAIALIKKEYIKEIEKYQEIIKQKELAMEHLDKAATERRNDSMQKLSLDTGLNFVSENKNGINFGELLKAGAGGFLEKFTEDLSKQGIELKNFAKASPTISLKVGDFLLCFEGIANGKHFEGLTDPTTIKDIYLQNMQELSFAEAKIEQELADFEEKRKEADDKDEKRLEDITKAKDSKSKDKSDLWNKLASGEFNKLLGSIGALSSGKFGVEDIGSILDNKEIKTIFMKE